jgi:hypothetical protein
VGGLSPILPNHPRSRPPLGVNGRHRLDLRATEIQAGDVESIGGRDEM